MPPPNFLSTDEVRQRFRYRTADGAIALLRREGVTGIPIGRRLFWPEDDVRRLMDRVIREAQVTSGNSCGFQAVPDPTQAL